MEGSNIGDKITVGLAALGLFFICDTFGVLNAIRGYFGAL